MRDAVGAEFREFLDRPALAVAQERGWYMEQRVGPAPPPERDR